MATITGKASEFITFSRTSNATLTDSDGLIKWAPHNLLLASEQFDSASWTKTTTTQTANAVAALNGTTTADTLTASGANGTTLQSYTSLGVSYTFGVWLKRKTGTGNIQIAADSGTYTTVTITSDWALYTVTQTPAAGTISAGIRIVTSADAVEAWGAHLYRSDLGGMKANTSAYPMYNPTTPKNALGYTEEITNAYWTKYRSNATATTITTAPNGLSTADKLVPQSSLTQGGIYNTVYTAVIGGVYTASVYAKAAELGFVFVCLNVRASSTIQGVCVNLATGARSNEGASGTYSVVDAGNGWWRISCTGTANNTTGYLEVYPLAAAGSVNSYTGDGTSGIYLWGAQLSDSASLDTYVPNYGAAPTAAAYYGPRLDYDPVTLAAKGLLVEELRANVLLRSASFDNSVWDNASPNSATVATNIVSPDGGTTGQTLTAATGGTGSMRRQSVSIAGATTYSFSMFIKQGTSTSSRLLVRDDTNGTNFIQATAITWSSGVPSIGGTTGTWATPVAVGNGWYRISGSAAAGAGATITVLVSIFPDNSAGTGTLLVYGAQLEAGSFATSYIPTGAATATRSADVASVSTQAFPYSSTEGTWVANFQTIFDTTNPVASSILTADGSASKLISYIGGGGNQVSSYDGATIITRAIDVTGPVSKAASAYNASGRALAVNGSAVATGTIAAGYSTVSTANLGGTVATGPLNGWLRQVTYLPRRISDAELTTRST